MTMLAVIVLAAGKSRRMGTPISKVVLDLAGQPVIDYIHQAVSGLNPIQIIYVISPELKDNRAFSNKETCIQAQPKGTGHAVQQAIHQLSPSITHVMVVCGDTPLIQTTNLVGLLENLHTDLTVLAMRPPLGNTGAYGRLAINQNKLECIIEHKDASLNDLKLPLVNSGCFLFKRDFLETTLPALKSSNAASEFYLTDLVKHGYKRQAKMAIAETNFDDMQGFNTPQEFCDITLSLQNRWRTHFISQGVVLYNPQTISFSYDTKIKPHTCIGPFVSFGTNVNVEENVEILSFCHIEHSHIKSGASIGPFAHLRGKNCIEHQVNIGNFVEVKGSQIKAHSKIKHLSYIGDALIGEKVNIGAGTITCNYDGHNKHITHINNNAMVGANTTLIAPITIGEGAYIAAGSTIYQDVSKDSLAITRTTQTNKEQGALKIHARKSQKNKKR